MKSPSSRHCLSSRTKSLFRHLIQKMFECCYSVFSRSVKNKINTVFLKSYKSVEQCICNPGIAGLGATFPLYFMVICLSSLILSTSCGISHLFLSLSEKFLIARKIGLLELPPRQKVLKLASHLNTNRQSNTSISLLNHKAITFQLLSLKSYHVKVPFLNLPTFISNALNF